MESSSSAVRSWRTAFLTLRDETLTPHPPPASLVLLRDLILCHFDTLIGAASQLPPYEVTADVLLLVELASAISEGEDGADACLQICHMIHDVCCRVRLEINMSSWTFMLNFIENVVDWSLVRPNSKGLSLGSTARMKIAAEILEILRQTVKAYGRNGSDLENSRLVRLLLCIISYLHGELPKSSYSNETRWRDTDSETSSKLNNLWEMQTIAFSMIGDALSRLGSSISSNLWQCVVEVLRKVMDYVASKNLIVENTIMSRFYTTLLNCLHLSLTDPNGSISGHVAGFVAALQQFFMYGLPSRSHSVSAHTDLKEGVNSRYQKSVLAQSQRTIRAPYRPPHLRRRDENIMHPSDAQSSSDSELSKYAPSSSDSDHSDNDLSTRDGDPYKSSKARIAAIVCIQDLCNADPKSLSSFWTLLLPENDVLQPRKYQATLMTCLLFDPVLKIRLASASALGAMLDGHSLVFLQVAEFKESVKCGSFTTLSSSLGKILMQLHTGILYMIQHETHTGLLASSFKVLMLLIAATPYNRMPAELLPTILASLHTKIMDDLVLRVENTGLLATAISCLEASFLTSPPSVPVLEMLKEDISNGRALANRGLSLIFLLLQLSEQGSHLIVGFEALQALRAVLHNYPNFSTELWEHISATVYELLQMSNSVDSTHDTFAAMWKGNADKNLQSTTERHIIAAIKVLDECLRAASGFRGADGPLECRLRDIQHISDSSKVLKISSAPSYVLGGPETLRNGSDCPSGIKQWCEVIDRHLPLALTHSSPLVRATSVTCFAGMTSTVFFSLIEEKQDFIISSAISAALHDKATSVRSAACRAIGVISCLPQIFCSTRVLNEFIHAAEINTHDPVTSVRITASWALANICGSLRQRVDELHLDMPSGEVTYHDSISILVETALRLTKDGDKIKSNAVRALGNLSRFIRFTCVSATEKVASDSIHSYNASDSVETSQRIVSESAAYRDPCWLERMVQAFVSCVTTGNVKVQWNVCHAMSNLFMNDSLKLQDMLWAPAVYSILLLLLRDSTNFKIRIHAAVALAVPTSRHDYGNSFPDVVQGLEHVLESISSEQALAPSSYKYKDNLEKQLTLTTVHVLGFASSKDDQALQAFLVKKAPFLEEWMKMQCSSFMESGDETSSKAKDVQSGDETSSKAKDDGTSSCTLKRPMLFRAINSLIEVYENRSQHSIAQRFKMLAGNCF